MLTAGCIILAAAGASPAPLSGEAELSSAPGLQLAGEPRLAAAVALPLAPTTGQAGAPTSSRPVAIAASPGLAFEAGVALPGTELTLAAAPSAATSGAPGLAATIAVMAGPSLAAAGASEMTAGASIEMVWLAAVAGSPGTEASALIASTPGVTVSASGATPFTFLDGTIWDDGTGWLDD